MTQPGFSEKSRRGGEKMSIIWFNPGRTEREVWIEGGGITVSDGAVEITSMNHGFAVDAATLPTNAKATHVSLFDGSNCGFELADQPAFSVQYHPEASPGPHDIGYLFDRFIASMEAQA